MEVGSAPRPVPCLCGAMLSAAPADIGREQTCASCGARSRVIWAVDPRSRRRVPARVPVDAAGSAPANAIRIPSGAFELVCGCGQSLVARREHAGKKVKCPVCGASMDVETYKDPQTLETRIRRVDPSTKSGVIVPAKALGKTTARRAVPGQDILCECGEYLRVSEEHLDKRAQCPACGTIMKLERRTDPQTSQTTVRARIVGKSAPPPRHDPDAWSLDDFR